MMDVQRRMCTCSAGAFCAAALNLLCYAAPTIEQQSVSANLPLESEEINTTTATSRESTPK